MTKAIYKPCERCKRKRVIVAKGLCESCYKNGKAAEKKGQPFRPQKERVM